MQRIPVDSTVLKFHTASEVTPALDFETRQQRTDETGRPLWQVQLLVTDEAGMSIERVRLAAPTAPVLKVGQPVEVSGLLARPYVNGTRAALSFTAQSIHAAKAAAA